MFPRAEKNLVEVEEIGLHSQATRGCFLLGKINTNFS